MKYATTLMLSGIMLFSLFSCGSDLGVEIPNIYVGPDLEIMPGVPNVIIKSEPNDPNEFIDPRAATVTYIVYDDAGNPARPGTIVKGLPGITGIPNQFTITSLDGTFTVNNANLPDWSPLSDRTGQTVLVTYTTSQGDNVTDAVSASNVYVPNRMHVRIRVTQAPELRETWYMTIPSVIVERQSGDEPWQQIPSHLRYLASTDYIYAAECPINDPAAYTSVKYTALAQDVNKINVSSVNSLRIYRLRERPRSVYYNTLYSNSNYYYNPDYPWDGNDHYFTIVLDAYYKVKTHADVVIKMAPIQAVPIIRDVKAFNITGDRFDHITGEMDLSSIKPNLFFKPGALNGSIPAGKTFTLYEPEPESPSVYGNGSYFTVVFNRVGENESKNIGSITINSPGFFMRDPRIGARLELTCSGTHFYPLNWSGDFGYGTPGNTNTLRITGRGTSAYSGFPTIPVTY